jgi:membrane associated rhomboid family serine protease
MTRWVGRLLIANVLVFFLQLGNPLIQLYLQYVPFRVLAAPWTLVSYTFLHGGFGHLFFNMLALWVFGPRVEARLGGGRFLGLYFAAALVGALAHSVFSPYVAIIGASGATYGVTYAFARYWPREPIYLWGVLRLEAWTLVILLTVMSLAQGTVPGAGGNVAHFAHLGGFLGGFLYLTWADRTTVAAKWRAKMAPAVPPAPLLDVDRWKRADRALMHPVNREEYERVLTKLEAAGVRGLSSGEIEFLERFSRISPS